ncbi:hypothetical protein DSECCO2_362910 [anaerobic digester metagenome]
MEERLSQLKVVLGITGEEKDDLLKFALGTVEDQVLAYIKQDTIPSGLERTLILMTASYWKGAGIGNEQTAAGPVSSVNRGDVSTSFASAAGAEATAGTFGLGGGDGFFGWRTALNAYRKLRW